MASTRRDGNWFLYIFALFAVIMLPLGAVGIVSVAKGDSVVEASGPATAQLTLSEFAIKGNLTVPAGDVDLIVTNGGNVDHDLTIIGKAQTRKLKPGESDTLSLRGLQAGTYQMLCTIPGHADSGMKATLTVDPNMKSNASASSSHDHNASSGGSAPAATVDYKKMDADMKASIEKFLDPAMKTAKTGNQPLAPTVLADGTKQFKLVTEITDWEVEKGRVVKAWTYNGQVPGPLLRVNVGDKVEVIVENKLPMGTDVHFHGAELPFDVDGVAPITQKLIEPGTTYSYSFVAREPAVAMFHAHHHAQMQVPNGLLGVFMVGDVPLPTGRTIGGVPIPANVKVAKEIQMVLNDTGVIGYSLNGKSFPATDAYTLNLGEWMVAHYHNEGAQIHPMHLHGFPALVYAKDGYPLDSPYWMDTLNVAPGERYSVLINADKKGAWVWHCHILNHVEREDGMFGMVTAVIVS